MSILIKDESVGRLNALVKKIGGLDVMNGILNGSVEFQVSEPEKPKLLESIATVELPACDRFVAADEFRLNRSDIKLWMSERFTKKFLGKVEENVEAATFRARKLLQGSRDPGIIAELGGAEETTLYHLFSLIIKQANGESGVLLTNGYANIFYVCDTNGELWAVYAHRYSGFWRLHASSVEIPDGWGVGYLVVSREAA